jgi:tetrahydromethanopterin S-methyltransferase subunit B
MDLPSASNKIINQLKELNSSTAQIPTKLDGIAIAINQPLHERIDRLEAEIYGNNYRDFIREEVQKHNDLVLEQKIKDLSNQFSAALRSLEQRITALENWAGQSEVYDVSEASEPGIDDTVTDSGDETHSDSAT